jgi:acetyltransferase
MSHQVVEIAGSPVSLAMDCATIRSEPCEGTYLRLRNERSVRVRPVRPADAETIQEFVRRLSITSRRLRFHMAIRELAPAMLARLTEPTGRGHVLRAETYGGETWCMVAMAQYAPGDDDTETCELALVVADAWQRLGLGSSLLEMLIQSARDARYARAVADVLHDNEAMLALGRAYNFTAVRSPHGATMLRLVRDLQDVPPTKGAWIPAGSAPQARLTEASA